ncbi:hypothetical protein F3Y22_tig00110505pilonHSYRG00492 [Hibiscus syriacus]|uniref:Uncharacterized protein n=1 Tax=Hibiscus syriacus TaxID=106335 RepID=A0A6A3ABJ4_HIBSY|nr:hypothetical protein F3Y22_tig00110505pilonHSYRG00492 [Hibiscus syriacus]
MIEHCKGRQKYLAQTRSPSDGGDVRWYFCKVPLAENELAASIPRTEIVGKSDYFRFGMRDSLAIEHLSCREKKLLSSWWKDMQNAVKVQEDEVVLARSWTGGMIHLLPNVLNQTNYMVLKKRELGSL